MYLSMGTSLQGGKYIITKVLGQGGFGITYEAVHTLLKQNVALKEFFMKDVCNRDEATSMVSVPSVGSRDLVEKFKQKFIKEAQLIFSMSNPHIVHVLDIFEENGTAYYVMENHPGGSLSDKVKKFGALSEDVAEQYIRQVADALAYIHKKNTAHLDVKPSNILLSDEGEAILIDFGISKHYDKDGEQTSSTPVGISRGYAPLEQSIAGDVAQFKPSTDIYALGATFYTLLTGMIPPEAFIVNDTGLERPSGISDRCWAVIEKSMQPRRKDRPQSIAEFLAMLDAKPTVSTKSKPKAKSPAPIKRAETGVSYDEKNPVSPNQTTFVRPKPAQSKFVQAKPVEVTSSQAKPPVSSAGAGKEDPNWMVKLLIGAFVGLLFGLMVASALDVL